MVLVIIKRHCYLNNQNVFDSKIDKLTVKLSKLTTQSNNHGKLIKLKIYKRKGTGQGGNYYYGSGRQQGENRPSNGDRFSRSPYRGLPQYGKNV